MNKQTNETASPKVTKALLDKLSDGLLLIDKNDQIVYCNRAAASLTDKEDIVGHHLTSLLKIPINGTRPQTHPILFRLPNSSTNALATFFDIHTLPGIQRLSKRAKFIVLLQIPSRTENSPASAYQLILGTLTVRIAHDFNNDLSSILGDAEYLQRVLELASSTNENVNAALPVINGIIRRCIESAKTIKQLQEYARQQPQTRDTLDLNESITSVLPIGRQILGQKIKLEFLPTQELPALYGDRAQLDQVLISLLIASKESMPHGGQITITTKTAYIDEKYVNTHPGSRPGHYILLTVQDTGTGIPQNPTEPLSTTGASQSGLHLPTAYAIIKQLSGYFDVEPWPGQGTRFEIYLPIYKQEPAETAPQKAKSKRPSNTTRRRIRKARKQPPMILIAEDDTQVRRNIESHLQQAGYRTTAATNGIAALEAFDELTKNKTKPALVISDLGLPGIDGKSLCKRIHAKSQRTQLLLTSGHLIDMDSQGSKTIDGFNFLPKPFQAAALLTMIEQILNSTHTLKNDLGPTSPQNTMVSP